MLVGLKGSDANAACLSSPDGELHLQVESAIQGRILLKKTNHLFMAGSIFQCSNIKGCELFDKPMYSRRCP